MATELKNMADVDEDAVIEKWTMRDEKRHVISVVKNFGKSRAVLFCATPSEWLRGYIKGVERRAVGFNGLPFSEIERIELKLFALQIAKKLEVNKKA
jgi:hypothetical protein